MRILLIAISMLLCTTIEANAQVSVSIGSHGVSIGFNVSSYPTMVAIPGYPVYYDPRANSNYFFYDGLYWVYQDDNWYSSAWYDGPWDLIGPEDVPLFVLRVPVRYYRHRPTYFSGWSLNLAPRWGKHWGRDWEQRRSGWDKWDRHSVPHAAPLPTYQRRYSGNHYPRAAAQQYSIESKNYNYHAREAVTQRYLKRHAEPGSQRTPTRQQTQTQQRAQAQDKAQVQQRKRAQEQAQAQQQKRVQDKAQAQQQQKAQRQQKAQQQQNAQQQQKAQQQQQQKRAQDQARAQQQRKAQQQQQKVQQQQQAQQQQKRAQGQAQAQQRQQKAQQSNRRHSSNNRRHSSNTEGTAATAAEAWPAAGTRAKREIGSAREKEGKGRQEGRRRSERPLMKPGACGTREFPCAWQHCASRQHCRN